MPLSDDLKLSFSTERWVFEISDCGAVVFAVISTELLCSRVVGGGFDREKKKGSSES
jgi:hypothetical protein